MGSGRGTGAKTLHTAALSPIYSTLSTVHQLGVAAHILTSLTVFLMMLYVLSLDAYVPLQQTNLPVLSRFQPAELHHQGGTLSLANCILWTLAIFCMASCLSHRMLSGEIEI